MRAPSLLLLVLMTATASAVPVLPSSDQEVVEALPRGTRSDAGRRQQEAAARAGDVEVALALSKEWLQQAHAAGDPRFAGRALGVLQYWPTPASAPPAVLLQQAVLAQYLHDFDGATQRLETLVAREPGQAQAWLTLATVRRVQGRYGTADEACDGVTRAGATLHGAACRAENLSLRGDSDRARAELGRALSSRGLDAATRVWLLTTLAEAEERAGQDGAAQQAYQQALAAGGDDYVAVAYADWLLRQNRGGEALPILAGRPDSDAVVLRRAMAGVQSGQPQATRDVAELRARWVQASARPSAQPVHARERAMAALRLDNDPGAALPLARANVLLQREPIDVLLLAEAAQAAGDRTALLEARQLAQSIGLVDRRLDGIVGRAE